MKQHLTTSESAKMADTAAQHNLELLPLKHAPRANMAKYAARGVMGLSGLCVVLTI